MIIRTFITKSNTIVENSKHNFGLNPVCALHYGSTISRFLVYFDINNIIEHYTNGDISIGDNVVHKLKMYNCGSIDRKRFNETINGFCGTGERKRAVSFEVIAFRVPCDWDKGIGFDSSLDFWLIGDNCVSDDASSWDFAYNGKVWPNGGGVYTNDFLGKEYVKFENGEDSVIIGRQKFDFGNENLEIDITKYINDVIDGKIQNNGICIAFSPLTETIEMGQVQYVGFFNENTNTFFQPYVESVCNKRIIDNRFNFVLGRENKLLFICNLGGKLANLDEIPTCTINGMEYPVKQLKKGVYEATVKVGLNEFEPDSILYDNWGNIKVSGVSFDDVELEFVVNKAETFFSFGKAIRNKKSYSPLVSGVNMMEEINRGEIRNVSVYFKEEYTNNTYEIVEDTKYRIYVKDGSKEIDVMSDNVEQIEDFNTFTINTNELLPNVYYVDLFIKHNGETRVFKNVLEFKVVNNSTNSRR